MFPSVCQDEHARMSALSFATERPGPGARGQFKRYMNRPVMQVAFPAQYMPLLFHGRVLVAFPTPTQSIRFPRLRGFNLSQAKRRCQDQEQSAAWYVACGTPFLSPTMRRLPQEIGNLLLTR